MLNLNQLIYFVTLAKNEHYGKASDELFISQPSLSYGISQLEKKLDVKLFDRVGRNIQLSEAGNILLPYVQEGLKEIENGERALKKWKDQEVNEIAIGVIDFLAVRYIPRLIQLVNRPEITFRLHRSTTQDIVKKIKEGVFDVGFCSYTDDPAITLVPVLRSEFKALMSKNHPLAQHNQIDLHELAEFKLITYNDTFSLGVMVKDIVAKSKASLTFENFYEDDLIIGGIVSHMDLVAIVGDSPTFQQFDDLVRVPISMPDEEFVRIIYMGYKEEQAQRDEILQQFIQYVQKFEYERYN